MDRFYYRWMHSIVGWQAVDTYRIIDRRTGDVIATTDKLHNAQLIIEALNK